MSHIANALWRPADESANGSEAECAGRCRGRTATVSSIARLLGVSRSTIYKYVPEVKPGGDRQLQTDVPEPRAELSPPTDPQPVDLR
ncbi:helix-turn-helix domain-containing protein [Microbispora catharanthi]|uniref:helix-turn-helix domain-containing protein n=1 Tax=Microbispora catharanthi TaxID=1712871 RepID=UPI001F0E3B94|nr:helix-turn-helix domain-containing protein [Microbispora catharanthi]